MDYLQMTAPCGLDCFNCNFYLAHGSQEANEIVEKISKEYNIPMENMLCKGCRTHDGQVPMQKYLFGESHQCAAWECAKEKGIALCGDCEDFPCDTLHPYADRADELPHNMKVFNLCLINKMGVTAWAESKAAEGRNTYFTKPWTLTQPNQ